MIIKLSWGQLLFSTYFKLKKSVNIIIEGLIWKRKDYFPWKKFNKQKNNVINKFYFCQTFILIASYQVLHNDTILISHESFFQEKESSQLYGSQFLNINSSIVGIIKNQFSKKKVNLVIIYSF